MWWKQDYPRDLFIICEFSLGRNFISWDSSVFSGQSWVSIQGFYYGLWATNTRFQWDDAYTTHGAYLWQLKQTVETGKRHFVWASWFFFGCLHRTTNNGCRLGTKDVGNIDKWINGVLIDPSIFWVVDSGSLQLSSLCQEQPPPLFITPL